MRRKLWLLLPYRWRKAWRYRHNKGMKVRLWRRMCDGTVDYTELRNVTEIHYAHDERTGLKSTRFEGQIPVAFESNIHVTGMNCFSGVVEFETELETEIAEAF